MNEASGGGVLINEGAECAHFKENRRHEKDRNRFCRACHDSCELRGSARAKARAQIHTGDDRTGSDETKHRKILQQVQTTKVQPSAQETSPLQVVAEFLQLRPGQVSELQQLLQARRATLGPLFQTAQSLIQQLGNLLNSGGNPAQVGVLVIEIHVLQQQMAQAQQVFLTQFVAILDTEQLQK